MLLLVFFACIFSTCKKYSEGPSISLRSKNQRVVGVWDIKKYLVDGADSTINKFPSTNCNVHFYIDARSLKGHLFGSSCGYMLGYPQSGYWEFSNHNNSITLHDAIGVYGPFFLSSVIAWNITELKYEEMHLQTEFNSKKYEVYLYNHRKK